MGSKALRKATRPRRILVCGDRDWDDYEFIYTKILRLTGLSGLSDDPAPRVIERGARGADTLARRAAQACGIVVEEYRADWEHYGRAAGPIRNLQMLEEGLPTEVWAFHDDLLHSKGTADMVRIARKARVPVIIFSHAFPEGEILV